MIDLVRFKENFSYLDNEIILEIIDIFLGEFDERFSNLQKDISTLNLDSLRFDAHSLKGVIANFMDPVTIELSKKLDEKAKASDANGLQEVYDDLYKASENLKSELIDLRKNLS